MLLLLFADDNIVFAADGVFMLLLLMLSHAHDDYNDINGSGIHILQVTIILTS